jgi:hypothetical protein
LGGEVPTEQNQVTPISATASGAMASLTRSEVIYEAEHNDKSLVFTKPEGMPDQMCQMAVEAYRYAVSGELPSLEDGVSLLLQIPATVAKRVTRLAAFTLTEEAQWAVMRVLASPEEIMAPVTGKVITMEMQASGPMTVVIQDEGTGLLHYVTLPRTAVIDEAVCDSGHVEQGQRLALSHAPVTDASQLDDDMVEAAFARLMVPLSDSHIGIPAAYLPAKLGLHICEKAAGRPIAYWDIKHRAVSLIIEDGVPECTIGNWLKINLTPVVESQRRAAKNTK